MDLRNNSENKIGVIGAGSFGLAIANILAKKSNVLLYVRSADKINSINLRQDKYKFIHQNIEATSDLQLLAESCEVLFPIIPSSAFRSVIRKLSSYLHPYHILIHGTKGLDVTLPLGKNTNDIDNLKKENLKTMSQVIMDESNVVRIGCLAGPNLAKELSLGQPSATVVASHFEEVIELGKKLLRSENFIVYGNSDLIGIELAGVLKNIIAIASGILYGLNMGENTRGLLISRGIIEMMYLGKLMGGRSEAFLGLAGIGDLVATCNSKLSRNFTVGCKLAKRKNINEIFEELEEVAEGVNTIKIIKKIADQNNVRCPITKALYEIIFEELDPYAAIELLMRYPLNLDFSELNFK